MRNSRPKAEARAPRSATGSGASSNTAKATWQRAAASMRPQKPTRGAAGGGSDDAYSRAAAAILDADYLLVCAGAGFSADSGLPVYKDVADLEPYRKRKLTYSDLCTPGWCERDPETFFGFWGSCFNSYFSSEPHKGYEIIGCWRDGIVGRGLIRRAASARTLRDAHAARHRQAPRTCMEQALTTGLKAADPPAAPPPSAGFVFTSNVDGFFRRSGWEEAQILEIHGNVQRWQCTLPCGRSRLSRTPVWELAGTHRFEVDQATMRAPRYRGARAAAPCEASVPSPAQEGCGSSGPLWRGELKEPHSEWDVEACDEETSSVSSSDEESSGDGLAADARAPPERGSQALLKGGSRPEGESDGGSAAADAPAAPQLSEVDAAARAESNFPHCIHCGRLARPCILMFDDGAWVGNEAPGPLGKGHSQAREYRQWETAVKAELKADRRKRLVILEVGCGLRVPTVRRHAERLLRQTRSLGTKLVRINLDDPQVRRGKSGKSAEGVIPVQDRCLSALTRIDTLMREACARRGFSAPWITARTEAQLDGRPVTAAPSASLISSSPSVGALPKGPQVPASELRDRWLSSGGLHNQPAASRAASCPTGALALPQEPREAQTTCDAEGPQSNCAHCSEAISADLELPALPQSEAQAKAQPQAEAQPQTEAQPQAGGQPPAEAQPAMAVAAAVVQQPTSQQSVQAIPAAQDSGANSSNGAVQSADSRLALQRAASAIHRTDMLLAQHATNAPSRLAMGAGSSARARAAVAALSATYTAAGGASGAPQPPTRHGAPQHAGEPSTGREAADIAQSDPAATTQTTQDATSEHSVPSERQLKMRQVEAALAANMGLRRAPPNHTAPSLLPRAPADIWGGLAACPTPPQSSSDWLPPTMASLTQTSAPLQGAELSASAVVMAPKPSSAALLRMHRRYLLDRPNAMARPQVYERTANPASAPNNVGRLRSVNPSPAILTDDALTKDGSFSKPRTPAVPYRVSLRAYHTTTIPL